MKSFTLTTFLLLLLQTSLSLAETTITVIERPSLTTTLSGATTSTPQTTPLASGSSTLTTSDIPTSSSRRAGYHPASTVPNSDDGSAGTDKSSYSLSTGGLIAVIVVVVAVAIFGIVSIVLYVLAKRRNWQVRASIKRMSRRLTGRKEPPRDAKDRRKRSGAVLGGERTAGTTVAHPPGQKRGVAVEIKDVEKGMTGSGSGEQTEKPKNKWVERLWGNDWK